MNHHRHRKLSLTAHYQCRTQISDLTRLCVMSYRTRDSQSDQSALSTAAYHGIAYRHPDMSLWEENGMTMIYEIFQYTDLSGSDLQTVVFHRFHLTDTYLCHEYAANYVRE